MKVLAPPDVVELVRQRGGRLFVWIDAQRCCGPVTYLKTSWEPPKKGRRFTSVAAEGFELFLDPGRFDLPDEIQFEVKGWRTKRVDGYWNGCVWAV